MRIIFLILIGAVVVTGCDESRVYEENIDLEHGAWMIGHKPEFEFEIRDTTITYNLYCNVRNSLQYPFSRLFVTYYLQDSIGKVSEKKMVTRMMFDPKTGKPSGSSGLGDIYDHQFLILNKYRFPYSGRHRIKFEQFMRADTLAGVLAVGVRVEKVIAD